MTIAVYINAPRQRARLHLSNCFQVQKHSKPGQLTADVSFYDPVKLIEALEDFVTTHYDMWIFVNFVPENKVEALRLFISAYLLMRFERFEVGYCAFCLKSTNALALKVGEQDLFQLDNIYHN